MRSVAVVGGGFGGVGAAVMLRKAGYEDVTVFERSDRIGGVWNDNTYPGAACDVPSHLYEFSFAPNPRWSRRFAPQAEIQGYIEGVAARTGVADAIRTGVDVQGANWDEDQHTWHLETTAGPHTADILITACGQLRRPRIPPIVGAESFAGPAFHTARWRHDIDLADARVAVIGTGASAIQLVPAIQPLAAHVDIYQRSPGWTLPKLDRPYRESTMRWFERLPALQRIDRELQRVLMDVPTKAMTTQPWLLKPFEIVGRRQIRKSIADPTLRWRLTPGDRLGCKRVMLTDAWYPTLAKPNVALIDDEIREVTPRGVTTVDGIDHAADVIVWATGFHAHDFVAPMEIKGVGQTLEEAWNGAPRAYLGATVPGFPNFFMLYGPNTNGGSGSVVETLECGIRHVLAALSELENRGASRIEVTARAADQFDQEIREALASSVWHTGCDSWYVDEHGHNASQWPFTQREYRRRTRALQAGAYAVTRRELQRVGQGV